MDSKQVDIQQLRIKHLHFKAKVRAMLYGSAFDEVFFSIKGPVSVWFDTVGRDNYSLEPEIVELRRVHQNLSFTALTLYRLYKSGLIDQAHEGLREIESQSELFLALLLKLEQRLSMN